MTTSERQGGQITTLGERGVRLSGSQRHHFSTIENAYKLIVLDQGEIRKQGTWDELIEKEGPFWKLYSLQCVGSECKGAKA